MKEFLKSFRRKLAFLLAVLLVLGNVNWEAMVRAENTTTDFVMPKFCYDNQAEELSSNQTISMTFGKSILLTGDTTDLTVSDTGECISYENNQLKAIKTYQEETPIEIRFSIKEEAKVNYNNPEEVFIIKIDKIDPADMGEIVVSLKENDTPKDISGSLELTYGNTYELQFSNHIAETDVEYTWQCESSDSNEEVIEVGTIQNVTNEGGVVIAQKVPLTINKIGTGVDDSLAPNVTLKITKTPGEGSNYNVCEKTIQISKIHPGQQEDFTLKDENGNDLPASFDYEENLEFAVTTSVPSGNETGYRYEYNSSNTSVVEHKGDGVFVIKGITPTDTKATITVTRIHDQGFYAVKEVTHDIQVSAKIEELMTGVSLKQGETALVTDAEGNYNIDGSISEQTIELSPVGMVDGASVSYAITDGNGVAVIDGSTLKINASKTGAITVKATATKTNYANTEKTIKILVNKIDPEITYTNDSIHITEFLDTDDQYVTVQATGPATISYARAEGTTASTENGTTEDGKFKIKVDKVGVIKVNVTSAETELYKGYSEVFEITITNNRTHLFSGIAINGAVDSEAGKVGTITYPTDNATTGVQVSPKDPLSEKTISYNYEVDKPDIATISDTGILTLKKAGDVVITVTAKLDNYENTVCTYNLTIKKADQTLTFNDVNKPDELRKNSEGSYEIYYGIENFTFPVTVSHACDANCGSQSVQYSVINGDLFAEVGSNGEVTLYNDQLANAPLPVTIEIQASKEACDCYERTNAVYSFQVVQYVPTSTDNYTLEGTLINEWYSSAVTIKPKEAGAKIGTQKWGTFSDSVKVETDGVYNNLKYFVRRSDNVIYELPVETIQIDTTEPTYPTDCIEYKTPETLKIISESLTLGFYKAPTQVTLKAKDDGSGVIKFTWWPDGKTAEAKDVTDHISYDPTSQEYSVKIEIPDGYKNKIYFKAYDMVGIEGSVQNGTRQVIVEDDAPVWIQEVYGTVNRQETDYTDRYYYNDTASLTLGIEEENFDASDFNNTNYNIATFKINGREESQDGLWSRTPDTNQYTRQITFSDEGDYTVDLTYTDPSKNDTIQFTSKRIIVDKTAPTRNVSYGEYAHITDSSGTSITDYNEAVENQNVNLYFGEQANVKVTVKDANFCAGRMFVYLGKDGQEPTTHISGVSWEEQEDGSYCATICLNENGKYRIKVTGKDYANNEMDEFLSETIIVDKDKPQVNVEFSDNIDKNVKDGVWYNKGQLSEDGVATITVITNNFRVSDFNIDFTGSEHLDDTTKTEYITYLKTDSNWVHDGNIHTASLIFDKSRTAAYNMAFSFTGLNKQVADTVNEKLIMDVNVPTLETVYEAEGGTIKESGSTRYVYGGATTVTLNLTEDYFMEKDVVISVIKDGNACPESDCTISEWVSNGTKHTKTIELGNGDVDGDYQIFMSYTDRSGNAMESLVSRYIIVDTKKPVVKLDYAANDPDVLNSSFYGSNRTATLTVQDRTIVETEKLSWTFTALNMLGQTVTIPEENITDWALDTKTHTWTRVVKLSVDAIYSFSLNGTDALGNTSDTPIMQNYTMDTTAPVDLKIDYSEGGNWVDNVLGAISFGYYKTPITVTLTAKDIASPIDYFDWTYTKRAESNNTPATAGERITSFTQSGDTATATFTLTPEQAAQYCGNITFTVTNKAGHQSTVKADENRVIVADTITPTRVVEFTPATQVINKTSRQTVETYDPNSKQDLILFYDKPMTITLKVTEANFYPQDAVVTVNDAATDLTWTQNGDEYTTTVTFSTDGDYVFKMTYADRSGNVMETYESSQITIDTVSPTISVDIVGSSSTGEYDGTKYYSTNTSAILTIVEHNFRAADVTGSIVALSSAEQGVGIQDFAAFLSNEANWVTEGDTHIASYPMTTDATYNFQVEYTDLAKHSVSAATGKYCVDKEAPTNVSLTYSTPVVETLLEAISFKFYNAQATVSVAAVDETAGVNKIVYSLLKADGASDTNLELLEQTITEETFTYSNGRREATAQFKLPASELRAGTQFNGTIKLIVYDRAMNNVAYENNERVIIDNIAPQLDIQYNDSTNERDNILYYGEEIRATLHMNEANFYRDDVKVTVSRNNGGFEPITVNWSDTNADVHIGNFTLSEDGDYVVMVEYADKSTNQMVSYTSEQMTIDTDMPVVTISGVENRKPYASGTVGFTVSVSDTNLDSDSFAPQFSAWVKEGNTIVQKDMFELGSVTVGNDKDSCTYVVDNLPEDGIYTISTSVMDMVGHTVDSMHMDNENGTENDFVRFSVNRNGSTYYIDDATTLGMLGSFVPYDKAGNVVVREVNPTALNDVTVTMFKDEKTIALEENSNFAFNLQHDEGEWYEYSYTIYRTNFEEDGIYSILLHSRDEAEHVAENTLEEKNVTISFAIDSTNPVLIISNLEDGATYNANSYTVYMQASDNLKLSEAVVSVDDKKVGSWTEAEQTLSDDDTYEFTINENNRAQKVSVSLVDKAGNRTTQDYSVTVTTNAFIRVINNKPLLFGIVGGATGAVVVPTAGIALFGKKKLFFVLLNKLKGVFIR